jgi:hypothetical protein
VSEIPEWKPSEQSIYTYKNEGWEGKISPVQEWVLVEGGG